MFNQVAALGLGVISAVSASPSVALADCGPAPASYPSYGPTVYVPAPPPVYAPAPPVYAPAPHYVSDAVYMRVMSRADYDYDGGITLAEAHAYGRAEFARTDRDRNGVLTRSELRRHDNELARGARHEGVVTLAEYDASVQRAFQQLDDNRNGYLESYELGRPAPQRGVSISWRWSL